MNAPLHPQPEPAASLPGLTRDAEDFLVAVEQLKPVTRRLQATGRDPTVLDGTLLVARAIVQEAAERVLALARDAATTEAPVTGGSA